jgi:hypothetical protein
LIFTEYTDTKRYLEQQLKVIIADSDREGDRMGSFHGGMGDERREEIKAAFNADPAHHPSVLLNLPPMPPERGLTYKTIAPSLFRFDVPWNPGRSREQRNGRIDRKLQQYAHGSVSLFRTAPAP